MHPHAPNLVNVAKEMSQMDFAVMPVIVFKGALRKLLIADYMFSEDIAEAIVAGMDVTLPPGSIEGQPMAELVQYFALIINNINKAFVDNGFIKPEAALITQAKSWTIRLE